MRGLFLIPIVWLLMVLGVGRSSQACSCLPPLPVDSAYEGAAAVFLAEVTAHYIDTTLGGTRKVDVEILRSWKGVTGTKAGFITEASTASCGFYVSAGREYLFYAQGIRGWDVLSVNSCSRSNPADQGPVSDTAEFRALGIEALELQQGPDSLYPPFRSESEPPGMSCNNGTCGSCGVDVFGMMLVLGVVFAGRRLTRSGSRPFR